MITELRINRFKCFDHISIPFSKLTLLAGMNATGKSTAIQSLLLLRQAYELNRESSDIHELPLNGPMVSIGTYKDVQHEKSEDIFLDFGLFQKNITNQKVIESSFIFAPQLRNPDDKKLHFATSYNSKKCDIFKAKKFVYLKAERIGPRNMYTMSDKSRDKLDLGYAGEYTSHYLAEFGKEKLRNKKMIHPDDKKNIDELLHQTQLWMRDIVPDLKISVKLIREADLVVLEYGFFGNPSPDRPTNTGFGITFVLPIIVGALISEPGSIMIVENPEAHLHPAGQSMMGKFLARVAASGVQVIVETHSDHVLNGVRIATKNQIIQPEDVKLNFFMKDHETKMHIVKTPQIDGDGGIDLWPGGFFDQAERDIMELM